MTRNFIGLAAFVGATLAGLVLSSNAATAAMINHNCTNSGSSAQLQNKLNNALPGDVFKVTGNCVGTSYVISIDRVTLRGTGGATITGSGAASAVTVTANQAIIEKFASIDGGAAEGVTIRASGSALISDISFVTGNDGVLVTEAGFVEIINTTVEANDDGVIANQNGSALIIDSDISHNVDAGVIAAGGGAVNIAGDNTINDNGGTGVFVSGGHVIVNGANTVQENGADDIRCVAFSRVLVFQSITSTSKNSSTGDCALLRAGGIPLFEGDTPPGPPHIVDCTPIGTANDGSINEAIANGQSFILVRGLCDEQVDITRPNITIQGENLDGTGKPVDGIQSTDPSGLQAVDVFGAQSIFLINLKISSLQTGVVGDTGAQMIIINSDITPGSGDGLRLTHNSHASIISGSRVTKNGISARHSSSLLMRSTTVTGDAGTGRPALTFDFGSAAEISGSTLIGTMSVRSSNVSIFDTIIDGSDPEISCSNFGTIDAGLLRDEFGVPLTTGPGDVSVALFGAGIPSCILNGFP